MYCAKKGASYMATQYGEECWCARNGLLDHERHGDGAVCDYYCSGDGVSQKQILLAKSVHCRCQAVFSAATTLHRFCMQCSKIDVRGQSCTLDSRPVNNIVQRSSSECPLTNKATAVLWSWGVVYIVA